MYSRIAGIIACPSCAGELQLGEQQVVCSGCGNKYPVIEGTPILTPNPNADPRTYLCEVVSRHPYAPGSLALIEKHRNGLLLDLGAGGKDARFDNVIQLDIFKFMCTDIVASADALPFKDGVFDGVISQAVFEHLKYPDSVVKEIWRVCKPGAEIKIDTAFLQPEHGYPDHYFNATQSGLRHWFRDFDFKWEGVEDYQHPMHSLSWFLGSYIDGLPGNLRDVLRSTSVGDLLEGILAYGDGRNISPALIEALTGIDAAKRRELAAGVSVLVEKNPDKIPSGAGGGVGFSVLTLESRVSELKEELDVLKPLYLEQQHMLAVKRMVVESVDQELYWISKELGEAKARIAVQNGDIEVFQRDQRMFETEIDRLREQVAERDVRIQGKEGQLSEQHKSIVSLSWELQRANGELQHTSEELQRHRAQLKNNVTELDAIRSDLHKANLELLAGRAELQATHAELERVRLELHYARKPHRIAARIVGVVPGLKPLLRFVLRKLGVLQTPPSPK